MNRRFMQRFVILNEVKNPPHDTAYKRVKWEFIS